MEFIIENITINTHIEIIDLENLSNYLTDSVLSYTINEEEEKVPLSLKYIDENNVNLFLFNDGRLVSLQSESIELGEEAIINFVDFLIENDFITEQVK